MIDTSPFATGYTTTGIPQVAPLRAEKPKQVAQPDTGISGMVEALLGQPTDKQANIDMPRATFAGQTPADINYNINIPKIDADKTGVAKIVYEELMKGGLSPSGASGIMANIRDESGFDPTLRHPDQPRFGGEAHYAHGLYQEGGDEWNNYAKWLAGRDWADPRLQTQFLVERLRTGYPTVLDAMNKGTNEQAAIAFLRGYLKPAERYQVERSTRYGRGVPNYTE